MQNPTFWHLGRGLATLLRSRACVWYAHAKVQSDKVLRAEAMKGRVQMPAFASPFRVLNNHMLQSEGLAIVTLHTAPTVCPRANQLSATSLTNLTRRS